MIHNAMITIITLFDLISQKSYQHDGEVDGDISFKEERFKVVCGVTDDNHDDGGEVYC